MKGRSEATKEAAATISSASEDVNGAIVVKRIAKGVAGQLLHVIEGEKCSLLTYTPSSKLLSFLRRYLTDNTILHEAIPQLAAIGLGKDNAYESIHIGCQTGQSGN